LATVTRPVKKVLLSTITLLLLLLALAGCTASRGETRTSPSIVAATLKVDEATPASSPTDEAQRTPLQLPLVRPKILVSKSSRRMMLYADGQLVRTYRVGLGLSPVEDKERQGDHRTPEGEFYVFIKNDKSAFYLSLGLSYPNTEDAERGLRDGLITRAQYRSILRAQARRTAPPQNTALGGDIYIHGNGATRDWTWGCVALEDADIKELFEAVPVGTTVIIEH
jgi:murein L,D-transpeptidase YafK